MMYLVAVALFCTGVFVLHLSGPYGLRMMISNVFNEPACSVCSRAALYLVSALLLVAVMTVCLVQLSASAVATSALIVLLTAGLQSAVLWRASSLNLLISVLVVLVYDVLAGTLVYVASIGGTFAWMYFVALA